MDLEQITPLILTFNEEPNLDRTLRALTWAREVVVLDSGSTDRTNDICASYPNVRVVVRKFDSHSRQWNYGLQECGIRTEWVLALDADYHATPELVEEFRQLQPDDTVSGYRTGFRYCVEGKPLSGTLYPPVVTLYRRARAHYIQDGHTQRAVIQGTVVDARNILLHDDRKALARWLGSQDKYATLEVDLLAKHPWGKLSWQDRIRRMIFVAPILVPLYCLTVGKGYKDGWHGLFYAMHRGVAEAILSLKLLEAKYKAAAKR